MRNLAPRWGISATKKNPAKKLIMQSGPLNESFKHFLAIKQSNTPLSGHFTGFARLLPYR